MCRISIAIIAAKFINPCALNFLVRKIFSQSSGLIRRSLRRSVLI